MATPHNEATLNSIAQTVLMPGDPKRSEFIAENFLTHTHLVNDVRGVKGFTGLWKDVPVTVMASGMGIPSIGIYSWELYSEYDVNTIIRVGSVGALQDDIRLKDIIIAQGACTTSSYIDNFSIPGYFAPIADYGILKTAVDIAERKQLRYSVGNILSSDNFYNPVTAGTEANDKWKKLGVLGIEMEAAGLYTNAAYFGKKALCICTVSDHIYKNERLDSTERQVGFSTMIELALDVAAESGEPV